MSWRDRPYSDPEYDAQPQYRLQLRRPSTAVVWLIVVNVAVHFVNVLSTHRMGLAFEQVFGLSLNGISRLWVWEFVSYMFVHDADSILHLFFNMLILYFIGTEVERGFGRKRFLQFYFACGIIGGLAYLGFGLVNPWYAHVPLVGASGAIYGLLVAAMIFYPQMQLIVLFFPVPIRVFGALMLGIVVLQLVGGNMDNPGGEICHFGGAAAAVLVFYFWGVLPGLRPAWAGAGGTDRRPSTWAKLKKGAWARKQQKLAAAEVEVDRILNKVHRQGIASLSRREKNILSRATQREREREAGRIDRL